MTTLDREARIQTICLLIVTTILTAAALYWLRPVLVPFVLALFVALLLRPVVSLQRQVLRVPDGLAVLFTIVVLFFLMSLVAGFISSSLGQLTDNAGAYQEKLVEVIHRIDEALPLERLGIPELGEAFDPIKLLPVRDIIIGTTNAIIDLLSQGTIVMIFVFFLLVGGTGTRNASTGVMFEIESRVKQYLAKQMALSFTTGALVGATLAILGVDLALVFGIFAFLLNFIPSIGSIIATLLPLPLVLMSPTIGTGEAILAFVIPGSIQFVIGNLIAPKILGDALDLHPVTILLALMIWGGLWGFVGMLLAVPITATLKILVDRFDVTAPVGRVLAGHLGEDG